jgi:peptide/nickel transport system permease protein
MMSEVITSETKRATYLFKSWRRFRKNPLVLFGLAVLITLIILAVGAPIIAPHPPKHPYYDSIYAAPSSRFILGTDELGRDMLSRIIWGARSSLTVAIFAVAISSVIGVIIGGVSAYFGGNVDAVLMRITDMVMTIPSLFFAIIMVSVFKFKGLTIIIPVIGFLGWPGMARVVRSQVLSIKELAYIEASKAMGEKEFIILLKEVLPNVITPIVVMGTMRMGQAILIESSLSFLGLGDPTAITWGRMLVNGKDVLNVAWWVATYPGVAIFLTVLGFNLLGDGLRDALDVRV